MLQKIGNTAFLVFEIVNVFFTGHINDASIQEDNKCTASFAESIKYLILNLRAGRYTVKNIDVF